MVEWIVAILMIVTAGEPSKASSVPYCPSTLTTDGVHLFAPCKHPLTPEDLKFNEEEA